MTLNTMLARLHSIRYPVLTQSWGGMKSSPLATVHVAAPSSAVELWAKRLSSGNTHAVVLANLGTNATDYILNFTQLGRPEGAIARCVDMHSAAG